MESAPVRRARVLTLLLGATALIVVAWASGLTSTSAAQTQAPTGWDGSNPFSCVLQQAAMGTAVPDPEADPYCVEFDKRRQNVSELGVVEFLSNEPGRVSRAVPKCFYFQTDHWRGSVVQGNGATKTYEYDGHYYFDKARGEGGAWVTNFNVNGQSGDPSAIPGIPPEYAAHLGQGTGGVITRNDVDADPACMARAADASRPVYATPPAGTAASSQPTAPTRCPAVGTTASAKAVGPIRLRDTDARVRAVLGAPRRLHRGYLRYCAAGGGVFLVGQRGGRSGSFGADPQAPAVFVYTTSPAVRVRAAVRGRPSIGTGSRLSTLRRAFPGARVRTRLGGTTVFQLRSGSRVLFGVRKGRVRYVAVHDRQGVRSVRGIRSFLKRAQ